MRFMLIILLCLLGAQPLFSQTIPGPEIKKLINKEYPSLETLYKKLHANPELSFKEEKTAGLLAEELRKLRFKVTENIGGYGIVGLLENGPGPVIMIRTDMDALPILEQTGSAFASKIVMHDEKGNSIPVMHACGHDMHMAVWLGVARVLTAFAKDWKGTLLFIGQPAEERGSGAISMINAGLFTKFPVPNYALALHVNSNLATGKVGYCSGYALANIDMVDIKVKGRGGHGAVPQSTIDPVVLASKLILNFQTIVSREIAPTDPALITVGSIHGGTRGNIIPNEVLLELTVRSFKDIVQQQLLDKIKITCEGTAMASGLAKENFPIVTIRNEHIPSVYNDPVLSEKIASKFINLLGRDNVVALSPEMFGEDFAQYGREINHIPILQYSLGTVSEEAIRKAANGEFSLPSTHSSMYLPELELSLKTGILSMSSAVLQLLQKEK